MAIWLPDWDTLDAPTQRELASHAERCPACAPKWELIRLADAHLEAGLRSAAAAQPAVCPSADELFDFGRGPGARRLSELERVGLKAHVAACAECAELVATLQTRPPAPLLLGDGGEFALSAERRRRWRLWVPLAAAAGLLAAFMWRSDSGAGHSRGEELSAPRVRFPSAQLVRGDAAGALLFPRERLLAGPRGPLHPKLEFELAPRERASLYRVELERHDGDVFAKGAPFLRLESARERLSPGDASVLILAPGHYTWEAWAVVDGLDVPLGRRDFEVVRDDDLVQQIAQRASAPEPARSESILHLLHDAGYVSDARAFARTLPATPEREEYLARRPVR